MARRNQKSGVGSTLYIASTVGGALLGLGIGRSWHSACFCAGLLLVATVAVILWRK